MAIYRLPPSPFVGGRQPLAPKDLNPSIEAVEVNDPSPYRKSVLVAVFIAWNFQPYIPQQRQIQIPQGFVEPEHIPPQPQSHIILSNWNQPDYYYRLPKKLTPPSVDDPPFKSRSYLSSLANWWYQSFALPQTSPKLITVEEAKVPFNRDIRPILSNWQDRLHSIQISAKIITEEVETTTGIPYLRPQLYIYIDPPAPPQLQRKYVHAVIAEEKIPFVKQQPIIYSEAPYPQLPKKLPIVVLNINDPPFKSRNQLAAISTWWNITQAQPQVAPKLISEAVVEKVPYKPYRPIQYPELWTRPQTSPKLVPIAKVPYKRYQSPWYADAIQPQYPRKLNPSVTAVQVDDPPFTSRNIRSTLITWNYPPAPIIQKYNRTINEVRVDDPPFDSRVDPSIAINWITSYIPRQRPNQVIPVEEEKVPYRRYQSTNYVDYVRYQTQGKLNPFFLTSVDDPPFGKRDWINIILSIWDTLSIPPRPILLTTPKFPIEPSLVNDPPFGRRVLWLNTVMDAWIPPPPTPTYPILGVTPPTSADIIIWMWKRVL